MIKVAVDSTIEEYPELADETRVNLLPLIEEAKTDAASSVQELSKNIIKIAAETRTTFE